MPKQKLANAETTATDAIKTLLAWRHPVLLHVSTNAHGMRFVANLANALRLLYRPQSKQPFQLRFSTRNFIYDDLLVEFHEKQKVAVVQMHNNGFRAPSLMVKNEPIGQPCNTSSKYQSLFSNFVPQEDYNDYESFTCDLNITNNGLTVSETKHMLVKHLKRFHSMPNGTINASIWQFICAFYFADRCEMCRNVIFKLPIGKMEGAFLEACVMRIPNSDVTAITAAGANCLDLEFKREQNFQGMINAFNIQLLDKKIALGKNTEFNMIGNTGKVTGSFAIPPSVGSPFIPALVKHIADLPAPSDKLTGRAKLGSYLYEWFTQTTYPKTAIQKFKFTKTDYDMNPDIVALHINRDGEKTSEESLDNFTKSRDILVLETTPKRGNIKTTSRSAMKETEETSSLTTDETVDELLPKALIDNSRKVMLQYFGLDESVVTEGYAFTMSELDTNPFVLSLGETWPQRLAELTKLRDQYTLFNEKIFPEKLTEVMYEIKTAVYDPSKNVFIRRKRDGKNTTTAAKRKLP